MIFEPIFRLIRFFTHTNWIEQAISHPIFTATLAIATALIYLGSCCKEAGEENTRWAKDDSNWYCIKPITNRFCHEIIDQHNFAVISIGAVLLIYALFYAPFAPYGLSPDNDEARQVSIGTPVGPTIQPPDTPENSPDFWVDFEENGVSKCGDLCRKVNATAMITNTGSKTAENIEIHLILKGHIPVVGSHEIWSGNTTIESLNQNETYRETRTVKFSGRDLASVKGNGCAVDYQIEIQYQRGVSSFEGTAKLDETRC